MVFLIEAKNMMFVLSRIFGIRRGNFFFLASRTFFTKELRSTKRIGPHDKIILDIIFGSMLGDAHAELRSGATRIALHQGNKNVAYLKHLVKILCDRGYCSPKKLKLTRQIGKGGEIYFSLKKNTYSFKSFNWIHAKWYPRGIKIVPRDIGRYLSARGLALWIMDDGSRTKDGVVLSTNSFTCREVLILRAALRRNFGLKTTCRERGNGYIIYILAECVPKLQAIVDPYMISSMRYKIQPYNSIK